MLGTIIWNLDPVALQIGPIAVRWYGIIFALTLLVGYLLWRWQVLRGGLGQGIADGFFLWGFIAIIVGARLGHCFFYHPMEYLREPWRLVEIWKGGLASHGATIGLVLALVGYAWRRKLHPLEVLDRFAFSAALGSAGIRLGNFLNSGIVGRPTDLPWGVWFQRVDQVAVYRHPSQLYEFTMGLCVLGALLVADRLAGREKRPLGLMTALFFTLYFAGRFSVEFFKAYHIDQLQADSPLTMGQYLSIVPCAAGLALLGWSLVKNRRTDQLPRPEGVGEKSDETTAGPKQAKPRRVKK